jgi:stage II sporulation protein P
MHKSTLKKTFLKLLITFGIFFSLTLSVIYSCFKAYHKITEVDQKTVVSILLKDTFNNLNFDNLNVLKNPVFLIKYNLNTIVEENTVKSVVNQTQEQDKGYLVYIYNTHDGEEYKDAALQEFNIVPTVKTSAYIMREVLKKRNINALVEENSVRDILNQNAWKYGYSYKASRILLEQAIKDNSSLKYFIDIHRDSSGYVNTTTSINNKMYARILFVVGRENVNYEKNMMMANYLNEKIKTFDTNLSRGIVLKSGPGVNGVYNQDISENSILIEIGGQDNNLEEINNTIQVLGTFLADYINN